MSEREYTTIPATKVHRNFGEIIRRAYTGEVFIIEKDGLPVVAVMSIKDFEKWEKEQQNREARLERFEAAARSIGEEVQRLGMTEEEVMAELEKAKQEVYERYYGRNE